MGTYYKQIAVYKTFKGLIEFVDDTRYEQEAMAWPHLRNSRIRINMKDYSKGTGENAKDVFYNLSPEEFVRLVESIKAVRTVSAVEKKRWEATSAKLTQLVGMYKETQVPQTESQAIRELIEQFKDSRNEVFAEAGEKLSAVFEKMMEKMSVSHMSGVNRTAQMLETFKKERETATKVREVFGDIKILNFEKYTNPDNPKERRVTSIRVAYAGYMDYPFIFEIANGWGRPKITKNNGIMIEEDSTHFDDTVQLYMREKELFPMLHRVELFVQMMTMQGMRRYYERVSDPVLNENVDE